MTAHHFDLRDKREALGLSLDEVSLLLDVDKGMISRFERGLTRNDRLSKAVGRDEYAALLDRLAVERRGAA